MLYFPWNILYSFSKETTKWTTAFFSFGGPESHTHLDEILHGDGLSGRDATAITHALGVAGGYAFWKSIITAV